MPRKTVTSHHRQRIATMAEQGVSAIIIAVRTGFSLSTVKKVLKEIRQEKHND